MRPHRLSARRYRQKNCPACRGSLAWEESSYRMEPEKRYDSPIKLANGETVYIQDWAEHSTYSVMCPVCCPFRVVQRHFERADVLNFVHAAKLEQAQLEIAGLPPSRAWALTQGSGLPRDLGELDLVKNLLGPYRGNQYQLLCYLVANAESHRGSFR